jgi:hypothetical protein
MTILTHSGFLLCLVHDDTQGKRAKKNFNASPFLMGQGSMTPDGVWVSAPVGGNHIALPDTAQLLEAFGGAGCHSDSSTAKISLLHDVRCNE